MSGNGYLKKAQKMKSGVTQDIHSRTTIGRVVDTNDPQQMGRLRVHCPGYGDKEETLIANVPWAMYVSPLGGITGYGKMGATEDDVTGPVAYGMWNIPKKGAYVLVGCIDNDVSMRYWAGCIQPQYMTHTMPHGRYTWNDTKSGTPDGPLNTFEKPIEPLYGKFTEHFYKNEGDYTTYPVSTPTDSRANLEWRSRGTDNQVSAITNLHVEHQYDGPGSKIADHAWGDFEFSRVTEEDGNHRAIRGPGYGVDQQRPADVYSNTGGTNYDSMVYSWTTPGFHSMSMDDRHDNSRIRLRTTSGHQIIMDDTNERIYINTSGGETWIELDSVGNIDIYASKNISTHAKGDISFTTDKTFRVQAKEGIHLRTDDEYRLHADKDINVRTEQNYRSHSGQNIYVESDGSTNITTHGSMLMLSDVDINVISTTETLLQQGTSLDINTTSDGKWTTGGSTHMNASGSYNQQSGSSMNLLAGGQILQTGSQIHLNGPSAGSASTASSPATSDPAMETHAYWTSRVPEHEPWGRMFMNEDADNDGTTIGTANKHTPEYEYTSPDVGRTSTRMGAIYNYIRGKLWHR